MNTVQRYVGKENNAHSSTPEAQNMAQTPPGSDDRNQSNPKPKNRLGDPYGRMGGTQVVHIDLDYIDGTKGEINISSPHIGWGDDIEQQAGALRQYINKNAKALGIVRHHFHAYFSRPDGSLKNAFSWHPYDCVLGKYIVQTT